MDYQGGQGGMAMGPEAKLRDPKDKMDKYDKYMQYKEDMSGEMVQPGWKTNIIANHEFPWTVRIVLFVLKLCSESLFY